MGRIIDRRRIMGKKGLLPSGYTQVEYIENRSTARIDDYTISFAAGDIVSYKGKVSLTVFDSIYASVIFGWYKGKDASYSSSIRFHSNTFRFSCDSFQPSINATTNTIYEFSLNFPEGSYFNDTLWFSETKYLSENSISPVPVFSRNPNGLGRDLEVFRGRIYYLKIYKNFIVIRNFIPCISPNNVVGMYDLVEGKFYSSSNNVAFIAGNPV